MERKETRVANVVTASNFFQRIKTERIRVAILVKLFKMIVDVKDVKEREM